ncbi:MAG TPA: hypothetical protein DCE65_01480, partial [Clostridiales bacterium]|nr:hypothetical protein [Clostridiales bacterium]
MSRAVCIGGAPRFCADFIIGFLNFYPLLFRSIRFFSVACKTPAVKILIRYPLSVIKNRLFRKVSEEAVFLIYFFCRQALSIATFYFLSFFRMKNSTNFGRCLFSA